MNRLEISDPEIDVIGHLFKLGIKKATLSLSWISGNEIQLIPTNFEVVPFSVFKENKNFNKNDDIVSVMQRFAGAYSCCAILFFTQENAMSLCQQLLGDDVSRETFMEEETLTETSNIIINSCLSNIATMLKKKISGGLPSFKLGACEDVTKQIRNMSEQYKVILVALEMRHASDVTNFNFILSMDRESMATLRGDVQDYLWDMH